MAPLNLPATMPLHASLLFSRNLTAFIQAFTKDKTLSRSIFTDDIQQGSVITHEGEVKHAAHPGCLAEGGNMTESLDYWSMLFVFVLSSFIGVGVIRRVSRLLHTPLMSITNAIFGHRGGRVDHRHRR